MKETLKLYRYNALTCYEDKQGEKNCIILKKRMQGSISHDKGEPNWIKAGSCNKTKID